MKAFFLYILRLHKPGRHSARRKFIIGLWAAFFSLPCHPVQADDHRDDLVKMSIEDLMNVQVYSASKKPQTLYETAAAIHVITQEDIHRSGATSIPELLRMVPGVTVQRVDSNTWDISARGFVGSIFANKMLVLIDGRAVYRPLYGGVWWDVQDVVLADIERIEVIRGPGGTLWGANAVNGVINVITKSAEKTQGTYVSTGAGTEEKFFSTLRHGDRAGGWAYRAYGKYFDRDSGYRADGLAHDDWDMARAGFRADKEKWTVQGDYYKGDIGQRTTVLHFTSPFSETFNESADVRGWNILARYAADDGFLQMYFDETDRESLNFEERRNRFDIEYMKRLPATDRQEISWGAGYRLELENITDTETFRIRGTPDIDQIFSFFIQDEIKSFDEKIKFIVGSKFEHNVYTGFEVQPNVRILYHLNDNSQVWAAVSHAVRTPSRIHTDGEITSYSTTTGLFSRSVPNQDVDAEEVTSFELGYRSQPTDRLFFDAAAFYSVYDELITFDREGSVIDRGQAVLLFPVVNGMSGEIYGLELSGEAWLAEWWKLKGYVARTEVQLHTDRGVVDLFEESLEDAVPEHTAYLQSSFDLPRDVRFDTIIRYVDTARGAPSYVELDLVLSKAVNGWTVSLVGQNLIEEHHKEAATTTATQVERGGYIKITREF